MIARFLPTKPLGQENQQPIPSQLLADEPAMGEVVIAYLKRLPELMLRVNDAMAQQNWPELRKVIHDIKGTGGGFGYPILTDLATKIEFQMAKDDVAEITASVAALNCLCQRIYSGAPKVAS